MKQPVGDGRLFVFAECVAEVVLQFLVCRSIFEFLLYQFEVVGGNYLYHPQVRVDKVVALALHVKPDDDFHVLYVHAVGVVVVRRLVERKALAVVLVE